MTGVSSVVALELAAEEEQRVREEPCVLTSVVVCERNNSGPATVLVCGANYEGPYYRLRVPAGGSLVVNDAIALPWGLCVVCQTGGALVSLGYR